MIDKEKFLTGIALLAGAFGREVDGPVQAAYYRVLNAQLDTAEFEKAVHLAMATETYWPSPAVLLGKVKQQGDAAALSALEHVGRIMSQHGGHRFLSHETYHREFDAPTKAAISAVGGLATIANTSEERWPGLQKRFVAAFSKPAQPKLAATGTDDRVDTLVGQTVRQLSLVPKSSGRDKAARNDE